MRHSAVSPEGYRRQFDACRLACVALLTVVAARSAYSDEPKLAVINAGVATAEDAPFATAETLFAPGDYVYLTFEIAGFGVRAGTGAEDNMRHISLHYQAAPEDAAGRPLTEPMHSDIDTDLSPEDKNWVPKRRASFLLPSFLAAGRFRIHIAVEDKLSKAESAHDIEFAVGGVSIQPASSINIQHWSFLRTEDDKEALSVPAYSAGDTVYARFYLAGFATSPLPENRHHVSYAVTVFGPDGKPFIDDPHAADLDASGFYPAQFIPGSIALKMGKANARGQYLVVVKARDLIGGHDYEAKEPFSIE